MTPATGNSPSRRTALQAGICLLRSGTALLRSAPAYEIQGTDRLLVKHDGAADLPSTLAIASLYPAEIDANMKAFAGSTTYTSQDRALLANVSAAVLNENVERMSVE